MQQLLAYPKSKRDCLIRFTIAIPLLLTITLFAVAEQPTGFVETFSGQGDYSAGSIMGFENPDWGYAGHVADNISIFEETFPLLAGPSELSRMVAGYGSFTQRIEINELQPTVTPCPRCFFADSLLSFVHSFNVGSPLDGVEITLAGGFNDESNRLEGRVFNNNFKTVVGRPSDIVLQIDFDAVRSTVSLSYDALGDEVEPLVIGGGPIDYQGSFGIQQTKMSLSPGHFGFERGSIDDWSLVFAELGDFDGDGEFSVFDLDALRNRIESGNGQMLFDVNDDTNVDILDLEYWIREIKQTWVGDANLDGEFNSTDFVSVFSSGEYEDATDGNSTWAEGDWNADGDFDSVDFVVAFFDAGYEMGRRSEVFVVPEPRIHILTLLGLILGGSRLTIFCRAALDPKIRCGTRRDR